ncbi:DMT family transporter [uncultured Amphritea sp.]|uniref:DMT family transporter n=1 Tax=uncultured Amphritea sp. TaxID=981605 RepID=UPI002613D071|nr:DMT family transporter [uncultured Amphritea sp.]
MDNNKNPASIAALWMVGALLSFMTMAIAGRELSDELNTFQILFFRSVIGLFVIACLLQRNGWQQVRTPAISKHLFRNLAHYGGQFGWFYGLAFIPLAQVFAIEFTVPVWTALLAVFFLGEKLTVPRMIAIGLGIVGMLIILRPGLEVMNPAALAVLGGAICYAISHIKTKQLAHIDTPLCILFYMTVIQLPLGLIPALYDWKTPSLDAWPWILLVGLTAMSAHYCLTRAMKLIDATVVVSMDFLRLPLIAAVGFLFYGEPLEWAVLIGALVMLIGNYISNRAEKRKLN